MLLCACNCHLTGFFSSTTFCLPLPHFTSTAALLQPTPATQQPLGLRSLPLWYLQARRSCTSNNSHKVYRTPFFCLGDLNVLQLHTCVAACWCVGFLCPHSNVPLFSSFLSLNFQPGSSELGEEVILMGVLEMGTCCSSTPLLLLVDALVFCVPIPTSHYSSSFLLLNFSLADLSWEKG